VIRVWKYEKRGRQRFGQEKVLQNKHAVMRGEKRSAKNREIPREDKTYQTAQGGTLSKKCVTRVPLTAQCFWKKRKSGKWNHQQIKGECREPRTQRRKIFTGESRKT